MPLVSVVIPVFNGEATLAATIASVLHQTLEDFELLIINDGSTDGTPAIVQQFQDPRIQLLSFPNRGLAASRNRGIAHSTSPYITFLDADDLWTPDKLQAQAQILTAHPDVAAVYSWTDCIDARGAFSRRGNHLTLQGHLLPWLLLTDIFESGSNLMIRKAAFAKVGLFDESLTAAEDWDMWLRLAAQYSFGVVPQVQVLYRVTPTSMSANMMHMETACRTVIERAFQTAPPPLQSLQSASYANLYKYLLFKQLSTLPQRADAATALPLVMRLLHHDPQMMGKPVFYKSLAKITLRFFLPDAVYHRMSHRFPEVFNTLSLLGYLTLNPDTQKVRSR